ncbi:hypothetical protein PDESU_05522 [Pontiella desulfatans]|uniref:Uncharacterized protein n=1 Tax=Pontiella desulfatans TaxID=2750659 RepID=A0A6C2UAL0_PONDE|nr:hypothetical protein PDESU_05522 [Pontiella desulfatans]
MYPGQKKSAMTWLAQIFVGISVLVLIGAVVFGIMVTRDGGRGYRNGVSHDSNNPLSIGK